MRRGIGQASWNKAIVRRAVTSLAPLGESDFRTPMGPIGPQKSGRVARNRRFHQPGRDG